MIASKCFCRHLRCLYHLINGILCLGGGLLFGLDGMVVCDQLNHKIELLQLTKNSGNMYAFIQATCINPYPHSVDCVQGRYSQCVIQ